MPVSRTRLRRLGERAAIGVERRWDTWRLRRAADRSPRALRIDTYLGHGGGKEVIVRGRLLDGPPPSEAEEGEGVWSAFRRTLASFLTDELPGVRIKIRLGADTVETTTDEEGYFEARLAPDLPPSAGPWATGEVELAAQYRGLTKPMTTPFQVRVPSPGVHLGVVSDVDDTILQTGAQRAMQMIRQTLVGSALTRTTFPGAPEFYRALAAGSDGRQERPMFYVSSSPWNLHHFLVAFLKHHGFPSGPLLLRDMLGTGEPRTHLTGKLGHIEEVLQLHPELALVLIGDSGQHDPEIYAEVARRYPDRIKAVYIREVRLNPGDGRLEEVVDSWDHTVPFTVAGDSAAFAEHAAGLGLISPDQAAGIKRAC